MQKKKSGVKKWMEIMSIKREGVRRLIENSILIFSRLFFELPPLQKKLTKTISDDVHDQQEWYWQSSFKSFCESTQPLGQLWHCFLFSLFYHQVCVSNHPLDVFIWHCIVPKQCRDLWMQRVAHLRKCNFSIITLITGNSLYLFFVIW